MSERVPEEVLWDFLRGAMMTKALAIGADLGIAEALAGGSRAVEELAREAGVDGDVLYRLLRALASDGVFAEEEPGVFRLTEPAKLLLRPGWKAFAHLFGGVFYRSVADLDQAARTGSETFPEAFGEEFWPWLGGRAEERAAFDRAMAARKAGRLSNVELRAGETVVDVGGGNGTLLFEVLGDRPDVRASAILRTIRSAARPGARLLVAENVIQPGNDRSGAKWLDLLMLVLASGRERTEAEWRVLLEGAGFEPVAIEDGLVEARCR